MLLWPFCGAWHRQQSGRLGGFRARPSTTLFVVFRIATLDFVVKLVNCTHRLGHLLACHHHPGHSLVFHFRVQRPWLCQQEWSHLPLWAAAIEESCDIGIMHNPLNSETSLRTAVQSIFNAMSSIQIGSVLAMWYAAKCEGAALETLYISYQRLQLAGCVCYLCWCLLLGQLFMFR